MRNVAKFALTTLGIYAVMILFATMLSGALISDNRFWRYFALAVVFVMVNGFAFFEGGTRGEAEASLERRLQKQREIKGIEPTKVDLDRCYKKWKGIVSALLGVSPVVLFAVYMFFLPVLDIEPTWQTPVMRILLCPYIGIFSNNYSITWYYLPLSLIYPIAVAVGYRMGPKRFSKLLRVISENNRKRLVKRRSRQRNSVR